MAEPARRQRRSCSWACCGWLLAAALLLPLLVWGAASAITARMYQRELDRLRHAGEPLTVSELSPKVPAGHDNAANVYAALESLDQMQPFMMAIPGYTSDKWDAEWRDRARVAVAANQHYFAAVEQASRMGECAFPVDWEAGRMALKPHLRDLRETARCLQVRAEVQLLDGKPDEAAASCATLLRVADHAETGPAMFDVLVAHAIRAIALRELERVLSSGSLSPSACRTLYEQLSQVDTTEPFLRGAQGERAWWIMTFPMIEEGRVSGGLAPLFGDESARRVDLYQMFGRPNWNLDKLRYLRACERTFTALDSPWPTARKQLEDLKAQMGRLTLSRVSGRALTAPVTPENLRSRYRNAARLSASRLALELELYRHDRGRYPDSLEELGKAGWKLPLDPFTEKPFRYRREPTGFAVWSLGPDMTDNNARDFNPSKEEWDTPGYDFVFRVAR